MVGHDFSYHGIYKLADSFDNDIPTIPWSEPRLEQRPFISSVLVAPQSVMKLILLFLLSLCISDGAVYYTKLVYGKCSRGYKKMASSLSGSNDNPTASSEDCEATDTEKGCDSFTKTDTIPDLVPSVDSSTSSSRSASTSRPNIEALEALFRKSRELVGRDYEYTADSFHMASRIVADCLTLADSIQALRPVTNYIAPYDVRSARSLQYLFNTGYRRIPKLCLQSMKSLLTINTDCRIWLTRHNCLSLLQEMFQGDPNLDYNHRALCNYALEKGSLDVLRGLHAKKKMSCPPLLSLSIAIKSGHWKTIKWISREFAGQIDWNTVIAIYYIDIGHHNVAKYLQSNPSAMMIPEVSLILLAIEGNLKALRIVIATPLQWQGVANAAAMAGHIDILEWVYDECGILPNTAAVEYACKMDNYSILHRVFVIAQRVPTYRALGIDALRCIPYAAMHNRQGAVEWMLENSLNKVLPTLTDIYSSPKPASDEAYVRAFTWIASKGTVEIDPAMMLRAVRLGHVLVFQWLYKKGLIITADVVKLAAMLGKRKILKAMYAIDQLLVCTAEIANVVETSNRVVWRCNILEWMRKKCQAPITDAVDRSV